MLKILSRRLRLHGYAIMSAIQDISGDVLRVEEGSLCPALHGWRKPGGFVRDGSPGHGAACALVWVDGFIEDFGLVDLSLRVPNDQFPTWRNWDQSRLFIY